MGRLAAVGDVGFGDADAPAGRDGDLSPADVAVVGSVDHRQ